ncbi:MAG TPA: hypothetical protein VMU07_02105 [Candidatus Paceibacterota bacterium]|nr:hypothetical protein [Candidatus Paceibacterota bacterium]
METPSHKRIMISIWVLLAISAASAGYVYYKGLPPPKGMYDAFAKCIASTTTKFYGAWWCPHCHNQKNEFGDAAQFLPYIECSTPDGGHQTQVCIDAGIKNYPTWVFPDGSTTTGETALDVISKKTNCPLPTSTPS